MTKEEIAIRLNQLQKGEYAGKLSKYAVKSIEEGRSSYPVANLVEYCEGTGIRMVMTDMATDEIYETLNVMDVHKVICMLMERYDIDAKHIFMKTSIHYTAPKKDKSSLSVNTMLEVCQVLHCKIEFISV